MFTPLCHIHESFYRTCSKLRSYRPKSLLKHMGSTVCIPKFYMQSDRVTIVETMTKFQPSSRQLLFGELGVVKEHAKLQPPRMLAGKQLNNLVQVDSSCPMYMQKNEGRKVLLIHGGFSIRPEAHQHCAHSCSSLSGSRSKSVIVC